MAASAPAIAGEFGENCHDQSAYMSASGVFQNGATTSTTIMANGSSVRSPRGWTFQASRSSSIYGASDTIRPISKEVRFMLKY